MLCMRLQRMDEVRGAWQRQGTSLLPQLRQEGGGSVTSFFVGVIVSGIAGLMLIWLAFVLLFDI